MSRIYIHVYDGNAESFDEHNEAETIGQRNGGVRSRRATRIFTDGEELAAAVAIGELLRDAKHFDVRQEIN